MVHRVLLTSVVIAGTACITVDIQEFFHLHRAQQGNSKLRSRRPQTLSYRHSIQILGLNNGPTNPAAVARAISDRSQGHRERRCGRSARRTSVNPQHPYVTNRPSEPRGPRASGTDPSTYTCAISCAVCSCQTTFAVCAKLFRAIHATRSGRGLCHRRSIPSHPRCGRSSKVRRTLELYLLASLMRLGTTKR